MLLQYYQISNISVALFSNLSKAFYLFPQQCCLSILKNPAYGFRFRTSSVILRRYAGVGSGLGSGAGAGAGSGAGSVTGSVPGSG